MVSEDIDLNRSQLATTSWISIAKNTGDNCEKAYRPQLKDCLHAFVHLPRVWDRPANRLPS